MTRKHKPQTAHKKRHAAPNSKPMKSAAADKAVAAMPNARDKDHAKHAAVIARKAAVGAGVRVPANAKVNDSVRPAVVAGGKLNADKRLLCIERRVPVMPEDRQSQLKLLIARGKEQGYLTYA